MTQIPKSEGYWAGVLGTAMCLLGLLGVAYGWTTITVGEELQGLATRIDGNQIGIAIGGVIHGASLGILSLSGVETAESAQQLLDAMPSPDYLQYAGWVRIGLSLIGVVIGFFLAFRVTWSILAGGIWAVISVGWFIYATSMAWKLLEQSEGHSVSATDSPLYLLNGVLHLVWPVFLAIWLLMVHFRGKARHWKDRP
ncbi:MAG: hypothetical protein MK116_08595 [Phycisphaerales bacterium]|nr:hypothetical protein [Phycisphaerales bacterium]